MKNGPLPKYIPNISPIYPRYIRDGDEKKVVGRMKKGPLPKYIPNISQIYPKYIRPGNEKKVVVRMKNGSLELLDEELEPLQVFPT